MLELINFTKSYGANLILDIKEVSLEKGVYWLRGPNGSGKSSLMRSVAGMGRFNGQVILENCALTNGVDYRRLISYAEAEPLYPDFLSGREILGMYKEAKGEGIFNPEILITQMAMEAYLDSPIGTYSSGMLKKLSLILAFTGKVRWILLDEPLNALDTLAVDVLYNWISQAQTKQLSFILSSHQELDLKRLPFARVMELSEKTITLL